MSLVSILEDTRQIIYYWKKKWTFLRISKVTYNCTTNKKKKDIAKI